MDAGAYSCTESLDAGLADLPLPIWQYRAVYVREYELDVNPHAVGHPSNDSELWVRAAATARVYDHRMPRGSANSQPTKGTEGKGVALTFERTTTVGIMGMP